MGFLGTVLVRIPKLSLLQSQACTWRHVWLAIGYGSEIADRTVPKLSFLHKTFTNSAITMKLPSSGLDITIGL